MKVLLLYASFGDGHRQVANALCEVLECQDNVRVVQVDPFRQTNGVISRFNEWLYETLTRFFPYVYGWSYDWTRSLSTSHWLWKFLAIFSRKATWRSLVEHKPDIVIQLFPDHSLAKFPPNLVNQPLLITVLTDFALHSRWFHENVRLYLFASNQSVEEARRFMSSASDSIATGIPIREQFTYCVCHPRPEYSTIVISAGGRGVFPDLKQVIECLLHTFPLHHIQVLCGRNQSMYEHIMVLRETSENRHRLEPYHFTDQVSSLLQKADFAVAKAGGISVSECMASGTPILFYKPQPGQERGNALAVEALGAGRIVERVTDLPRAAKYFRGEALAAMKRACHQYGSPAAARLAVGAILEAYNTSRGVATEER